VITPDTSGAFAIVNRHDAAHRSVARVLERESDPLLLPIGVLAEIAYLIDVRLAKRALDLFLDDIEAGAFTLDHGDGDMPRIRELVKRYAGLPLGFADASVIACAERSGGRALTLDRRDFGVVGREGTITIEPDEDSHVRSRWPLFHSTTAAGAAPGAHRDHRGADAGPPITWWWSGRVGA
jgi:uncharacterized protein